MDNIFSSHRRNLMIMTALMFLLSLTNTEITTFKFLSIDFTISNNIQYISSFNDIFFVIWLYTYFIFSTDYISRIKHEVKKDFYTNLERKLIFEYINDKSRTVNIIFNISKYLFGIIYARLLREFYLPTGLFMIVIIFEYNAISFFSEHYFILLGYLLFTFTLLFPSIILIISVINLNRKINRLEKLNVLNDILYESKGIQKDEYIDKKSSYDLLIQKYEKILDTKD